MLGVAGGTVSPGKTGVLKNARHLLALAGLFLAGLVAFLVARALLVPSDFGVYGHFRTSALADNRARPLVYAGRAACEGCHVAEATLLASGKHGRVSCETCHGPLGAHARDPEAAEGRRPDGRAVCLGCHAANAAKPRSFPQIQPQEHFAEEVCLTCHPAHRPEGE